tara:strand:+ start:487 stop:609 length:123 start_codon:yes stop_codon:yes gene_type:complete
MVEIKPDSIDISAFIAFIIVKGIDTGIAALLTIPFIYERL